MTWICILGCLLVAGCGESGPKRYRLKGSVKYAGAPLKYGTIQFDPDVGNEGPQSVAEVIDGEYDTKANGGLGVISGKVVVRIMGFESKPVQNTSSDEPTPALFEEYQTNIEIPAEDSDQDFDVPQEANQKKRNEAPVNTGP